MNFDAAKSTGIWIAVMSISRQLAYVLLGVAATFIHSHPEIFGDVETSWASDEKFVAQVALVVAFLALSFFSVKGRVKSQKQIKTLQRGLINLEDSL